MDLQDTLSPERTRYGLTEQSKRRVLENASELLCQGFLELKPEDISQGLTAREKLGSTVIGHGVAIPHARVPHLDQAIASLIHLKEGVKFDGQSDEVDLVFTLLVPEDANHTHLELLSQLAGAFRSSHFREALRNAEDDSTLYQQAIHFLSTGELWKK